MSQTQAAVLRSTVPLHIYLEGGAGSPAVKDEGTEAWNHGSFTQRPEVTKPIFHPKAPSFQPPEQTEPLDSSTSEDSFCEVSPKKTNLLVTGSEGTFSEKPSCQESSQAQ